MLSNPKCMAEYNGSWTTESFSHKKAQNDEFCQSLKINMNAKKRRGMKQVQGGHDIPQ
jgi:hypothetical protein